MIFISTDYKKCSICNELKEATLKFYYKNKTAPDGLFPYCKECNKNKTKKWRENNPDKHRELYLRRNSTLKQQESMYEINKRRREEGLYREWQRDNRGKISVYNESRQMNKAHDISDSEWESCKKYFEYQCAYCGISEDKAKELYGNHLHREHVVHDGSNKLDNCVPACKSCNSSKYIYVMEDWYREDNPIYTESRLKKIYQWLNKDVNSYIEID